VRALAPAAPALRPTLAATVALAPAAERLFRRTAPVIALSATALPAATDLLRRAKPLVDVLLPIGEDLVPVARYLDLQKDQVVSGAANVPSVLNAGEPNPAGDLIRYLRAIVYLAPQGFVGYAKQLPYNRRNPYLRDRGLDDIRPGSAAKAYDCSNTHDPETFPAPEAPPPCNLQGPFPAQFGGGDYPRLTRDKP
jgi:hypothetical protein